MNKFIAKSVAMVRPNRFAFNPETAVNNAFQNRMEGFTASQIQDIALLEFDNMVNTLQKNGIEVIVFQDNGMETPDSIFPNNWFSTFTNELILYSMFTPNRRNERKAEIYDTLAQKIGKQLNERLLDLEYNNEILEGTGSLVCDYASKTAFAALSPRTNETALKEFEKITGYETVPFKAKGPDGNEIYHTNVMMTMGDSFVLIGLETITSEHREAVRQVLIKLGKDIIELSNDQIFNHFCGNMLQLQNNDGDRFLVMSEEAKNNLSSDQIELITKKHNNKILSSPIHIIEKIGGGSARCMLAELFYAS